MTNSKRFRVLLTIAFSLCIAAAMLVSHGVLAQQQEPQKPSSFMPVIEEPFEVVRARDKAAKARVMAAHQKIGRAHV